MRRFKPNAGSTPGSSMTTTSTVLPNGTTVVESVNRTVNPDGSITEEVKTWSIPRGHGATLGMGPTPASADGPQEPRGPPPPPRGPSPPRTLRVPMQSGGEATSPGADPTRPTPQQQQPQQQLYPYPRQPQPPPLQLHQEPTQQAQRKNQAQPHAQQDQYEEESLPPERNRSETERQQPDAADVGIPLPEESVAPQQDPPQQQQQQQHQHQPESDVPQKVSPELHHPYQQPYQEQFEDEPPPLEEPGYEAERQQLPTQQGPDFAKRQGSDRSWEQDTEAYQRESNQQQQHYQESYDAPYDEEPPPPLEQHLHEAKRQQRPTEQDADSARGADSDSDVPRRQETDGAPRRSVGVAPPEGPPVAGGREPQFHRRPDDPGEGVRDAEEGAEAAAVKRERRRRAGAAAALVLAAIALAVGLGVGLSRDGGGGGPGEVRAVPDGSCALGGGDALCAGGGGDGGGALELCYDVSPRRENDGGAGAGAECAAWVRDGGTLANWCCRGCRVCPRGCRFPVAHDCKNLNEEFFGSCDCPPDIDEYGPIPAPTPGPSPGPSPPPTPKPSIPTPRPQFNGSVCELDGGDIICDEVEGMDPPMAICLDSNDASTECSFWVRNFSSGDDYCCQGCEYCPPGCNNTIRVDCVSVLAFETGCDCPNSTATTPAPLPPATPAPTQRPTPTPIPTPAPPTPAPTTARIGSCELDGQDVRCENITDDGLLSYCIDTNGAGDACAFWIADSSLGERYCCQCSYCDSDCEYDISYDCSNYADIFTGSLVSDCGVCT